MSSLRLGLHTFTAGSLEKAALKAAELGANTFQIFSSSPRMWRSRPADPVQIALLQRARDRFDLNPLVIHSSYLINLGSCNPALHAQSIAGFRSELERAIAIGADYVVLHPGNCKGHSIEEAILNIVEGLAQASRGLKSGRLRMLLENTAGSTNSIGTRFEELAVIRQLAEKKADLPIGFCLDTAHCLASGLYDVSSQEGLRFTVKAAEVVLSLDNVKIIHTNDSKVPLGARVDRHQHIGEGYIGVEGFHRILTHPKLRSKAFILETPVDKEGDDRRNLDMLKSLCRKSSTTTKKSN